MRRPDDELERADLVHGGREEQCVVAVPSLWSARGGALAGSRRADSRSDHASRDGAAAADRVMITADRDLS
jgi:hypothetical protein